MKVIENIELLKKLQPYLKDVETEYVITDYKKVYTLYEVYIVDTNNPNSAMYWIWEPYWRFNDKIHPPCLTSTKHYDWIYKTLQLEEAIELLPLWIHICIVEYKGKKWYEVNTNRKCFISNNLMELLEKMLEYLIDNDLLWTNYNKK